MRFPHWQFFESVDDELNSLSRIIEFALENFSTFSVFLSRLHLSVCSEIDVVAKLLCTRIAPTKSPERINEYCPLITGKFPKFSELRIEMPAHGLDFQPWLSWSSSTTLEWCQSYMRRTPFFRPLSAENKMDSPGLLSSLFLFVCRTRCALNPFGKERTSRAWHRPSSLSLSFGFQYLPPQAV